MCIIATKPVGKTLQSKETIETMFTNNKDGAGYMYAMNGTVYIRKGFMTVKSLMASLRSLGDVTNIPLIMHFRIGTHGGNTPANTHPFPISEKVADLQAKKIKCNLAMVHNGIISSVTPRKGISDTMEYILSIVKPLQALHSNFLARSEAHTIIETTLGVSRLAFLDSNGVITTFGEWVEHDGYMYSNKSYEPKPVAVSRTYPNYDYSNYNYGYGYGGNAVTKKWLTPLPANCSIDLINNKDDYLTILELKGTYAISFDGALYKTKGNKAKRLWEYPNPIVYSDKGIIVDYDATKSESFELTWELSK